MGSVDCGLRCQLASTTTPGAEVPQEKFKHCSLTGRLEPRMEVPTGWVSAEASLVGCRHSLLPVSSLGLFSVCTNTWHSSAHIASFYKGNR